MLLNDIITIAATQGAGAAAAAAPPTDHMVNGTFVDGTGWSLQSSGTALTIAGGVLAVTNSSGLSRSATGTLSADPGAGTAVTIEFDVTGWTVAGGNTSAKAANGVAVLKQITGNGHWSYSVTASSGGATMALGFPNNANFNIDNVTATW